ncbi:MAG: gamma carbonic anhydrase family protein [Casimicrobiaceae bacterium]|nr:gamma carbonic anhydrase family protein [Casimicrobiaceae bacterium]MCX8098234.1 gamma carbonic anhydrase family protein [Casimicrobiaceae bacterium]MDW8311282.1 gamma carbonic anhydrase family protein [Burkholderiales bacterium]
MSASDFPLYAVGERVPTLLGEGHYIADTARVIGSVTLHAHVSIWFGAVLRGDCEQITIGEGSNVQDLSIVHADYGFPVVVGRECVIGHQVCLHGCTIEDGALIGIGAAVLNGAVIGAGSLVGAHALVPEGKRFPPRSLILGAPAKVVRELSEEDLARIRDGAQHYVANGALFRRTYRRV